MSLVVVVQPTAEPVSLAEARAHLRVDHFDDDAKLVGFIVAAREMAEHELQRSLCEKTYEMNLHEFPAGAGAIRLPMGPLPGLGSIAITSIKYTDTADAEQTIDPSAYVLDGYSFTPSVAPVSGWPTPKVGTNVVRVRYTSGHSSPGNIPAAIKSWMLLMVGQFYENREAVNVGNIVTPLPFVGRLLDPYRSFL